jgi:hypothetical protein
MRSRVRISLVGLLASTTLASAGLIAPTAEAAFKVSAWEAGTCENTTCKYAEVKEEVEKKGHSEQAFTQSAGHPRWGITAFEIESPGGTPGGKLKRVRVDVPEGLAANPEAPAKQCTKETFEKNPTECPAASEVGTTELTVSLLGTTHKASGKVYSLKPPVGLPLYFGIYVNNVEGLGEIIKEKVYLEGHVSFAKEEKLEKRGIPSGDYHEWFEINNVSETTPVIRSQLNFNGRVGGSFITLPTKCSKTTTSYLELESWEGAKAYEKTETPVGVDGCANDPFQPSAEVHGETTQSDSPDGASTVVKVTQNGWPEINTADIKDASVTLPEGMTLDPSAAHGLEACTEEQMGFPLREPVKAVTCPAASKVGTVAIETDLPPGSLKGNVYLGSPTGAKITGPPFTIYVDAEALEFGVSVRLKGLVSPDPKTGRLTATFSENPQLPFSEFVLKSNSGPRAPLANPLACGTTNSEASFTPYTELKAWVSTNPFTTTGCGSFSWSQSTSDQPSTAGAFGGTSYTFSLARSDGQQYLSKVSTALPVGLVGAIPAVPLCGEQQASQGTCGAASQIGTASVTVGAGSEPYAFSGPVYLTGAYGGGPFGLSIPVQAEAGPFNFGTVVTRTAIFIDPHSARVSAVSSIPTIVKGVPLRLKSVSVTVNRANFLYNPTSCGVLSTDTTLTSTFAATQSLSSTFQPTSCAALPFTPSFSAATSSKYTKENGDSLQVNVTQPPHQANIRSVVTQLPIQLPARLTTLQQACPEATYAANPFSCPPGSNVGSAAATTPVLPGTLSGPAYLVSHGGAAFPDLDIVLEGSGVRVLLEGNTNIKGGITTSTFASLPDAPLSSFSLTLPMSTHSALAAYGNLCGQTLYMPTTITAQNGAQVKQNTVMSVAGCAGGGGEGPGAGGSLAEEEGVVNGHLLFKIIKRRIVGHTLLLTVKTFVPGRLSAAGKYLRGASRKLRKPAIVTLKLKLTGTGARALRGHHPLKLAVRVTLTPLKRGQRGASARTRVTFRR